MDVMVKRVQGRNSISSSSGNCEYCAMGLAEQLLRKKSVPEAPVLNSSATARLCDALQRERERDTRRRM